MLPADLWPFVGHLQELYAPSGLGLQTTLSHYGQLSGVVSFFVLKALGAIFIRIVPETPTSAGLGESTAIYLQFVQRYAPHLYRWTFLASKPSRKGSPTAHLPFVLEYASHLHCSTPPMCTAVLLRMYWGVPMGSPGNS